MLKLKKQLNRLLALLVCCVLLCCPVSADDQACSLRVTLLDEADLPVKDINVEICRITDFDGTSHTLAQDFADLSIPADQLAAELTAEQAEQIYQYVIAREREATLKVTNADGYVDYTDLQQGIYLVFERGSQIISFQPYLISLPTVSSDTTYYEIYSQPKVVSADSRSIMVKIEWIDNNNAAGKRPQNVDVVLTRDVLSLLSADTAYGTPFRRVTLNPQCEWQHTFHMLPLTGDYGVIESPVPEYEYLGCEEVYEGFILTYRYQRGTTPTPGPGPSPKPDPKPDGKLPQTGFQVWPVYLMLAGGAALVIWGMADLCINKEEP